MKSLAQAKIFEGGLENVLKSYRTPSRDSFPGVVQNPFAQLAVMQEKWVGFYRDWTKTHFPWLKKYQGA